MSTELQILIKIQRTKLIQVGKIKTFRLYIIYKIQIKLSITIIAVFGDYVQILKN